MSDGTSPGKPNGASYKLLDEIEIAREHANGSGRLAGVAEGKRIIVVSRATIEESQRLLARRPAPRAGSRSLRLDAP